MKIIHKFTNEIIIDHVIDAITTEGGMTITYMGKGGLYDDVLSEQKTFIDSNNIKNISIIDEDGSIV